MIILLRAWRRHWDVHLALESIRRTAFVEGTKLLVHIDPGYPLVKDAVAHGFRFLEKYKPEMIISQKPRGLRGSFVFGMDEAFKRDEYAISLDDDFLVGRDFLQYHDYCHRTFMHDDKCFCATTFKHSPTTEDPQGALTLILKRLSGISLHGFGITAERWPEIKDTILAHNEPNRMWYPLNRLFLRKRDVYCVAPWVSRTKLIAYDGDGSVHEILHKNTGAWDTFIRASFVDDYPPTDNAWTVIEYFEPSNHIEGNTPLKIHNIGMMDTLSMAR